MGNMEHVGDEKKELVKEVHFWACLGVRINSSSNSGIFVQNRAESSLTMKVKAKHDMDTTLVELKKLEVDKKIKVFSKGGDGILHYLGWLCVTNIDGLREKILDEANNS